MKPISPAVRCSENPSALNAEGLYFRLLECGFCPRVYANSLHILSLVYEIGDEATDVGFALANETRKRFTDNIEFRERMLEVISFAGELLQPYDLPPPRIDVTRTLNDARADLGIRA